MKERKIMFILKYNFLALLIFVAFMMIEKETIAGASESLPKEGITKETHGIAKGCENKGCITLVLDSSNIVKPRVPRELRDLFSVNDTIVHC
jgi:hypothetical protein